jgi:hypothetical protein
MNADMLNRETEYPPPLSLSLSGGGGANVPSPPSGSATAYMNKIDNRRLKIWSVVYNRPMYAKV